MGWAVVAAQWGSNGLELAGIMSGVLPQSTVSAGESEAMIALFRELDVEVDLTTDSKVALRQLRSPHSTANTYLSWREVWENRDLIKAP